MSGLAPAVSHGRRATVQATPCPAPGRADVAWMSIGDYAIIGDCHSAALVSRAGSIDWLCWPRFDSPSIFGALLDPRAGHWRIAPAGARRTGRRYVGDTNVLETRFVTGE